jgi:hypothetical protein
MRHELGVDKPGIAQLQGCEAYTSWANGILNDFGFELQFNFSF